MKRRKTVEDRIVDGVNTLLMTLIAIVTLYPFYYILIASFNTGLDTAQGGLYLFPRQFTLENYQYFFSKRAWVEAFGITILRTVVGTIVGILFTSMVAYGLAKKDLILRKFYYLFIIVAMNVSGGLITYYVVLRSIHLLNSFWVYIIPSMLSLFFLLIAVSFFQEIPSEMSESARMDGASEVGIFLRIILPVSMPLLATMCLFLGAAQWNSWLDSAYFVQNNHLRTLAYRMMEVINQANMPTDSGSAQYTAQAKVTSFSVQATAMIISVFPIVCVYPFVQKHFVQGMMLGSVKG